MATSIDTAFSRALLSQIVPEVRAAGHNPTKDAWVWSGDRRTWEFHGPDKFYWYGRASNAYEARYHGWVAFLEKRGRR